MNHHQENVARHLEPGVRQKLLPFDPPFSDGDGRKTLVTRVLSGDFLPLGLCLWGVDDRTRITRVMVGNQENLMEGYGEIPASWFSSDKSFEELKALSEEGQLLPTGVLPKRLHRMDVAHLGNTLTVQIHGAVESGCFFGLSRDGSAPPSQAIRVEKNDRNGDWTAIAVRRGLLADEEIGRATAPSLESASTLIGSLLGRR